MVARILASIAVLTAAGAALISVGLTSNDTPTSAAEYRQRDLERYFAELQAFHDGLDQRHQEFLGSVRFEEDQDIVSWFRLMVILPARVNRALVRDLQAMDPPDEVAEAHDVLVRSYLDSAETLEAQAGKITDAESLDEWFLEGTGFDPHFRDFEIDGDPIRVGAIGGLEPYPDDEVWVAEEDLDLSGGTTLVLEPSDTIALEDDLDPDWLDACLELESIAEAHGIELSLRCHGYGWGGGLLGE